MKPLLQGTIAAFLPLYGASASSLLVVGDIFHNQRFIITKTSSRQGGGTSLLYVFDTPPCQRGLVFGCTSSTQRHSRQESDLRDFALSTTWRIQRGEERC
ncbi:hypothetical protein BDN71DRAFT_226923 [Pleurotus eryngii]|uniref:Secreted protein n=1 Tax=Pleurotus eryngii TaxID=5323 RepID=A0A9P6A3H9_PLEER|nr:hypothetical protein BDN71DRAFT_226923 [Pleurotus eryngii]